MNTLQYFKLGKSFFSTFRNIKGSDAILKHIKDAKNPVLLDFYAEDCQNCIKLAPRLEKEAKSSKVDLDILRVDIKDKSNVDILTKYNVKDAPRLILLKEGKATQEKAGNVEDIDLQALFR
jgi:thioredoxin 1